MSKDHWSTISPRHDLLSFSVNTDMQASTQSVLPDGSDKFFTIDESYVPSMQNHPLNFDPIIQKSLWHYIETVSWNHRLSGWSSEAFLQNELQMTVHLLFALLPKLGESKMIELFGGHYLSWIGMYIGQFLSFRSSRRCWTFRSNRIVTKDASLPQRSRTGETRDRKGKNPFTIRHKWIRRVPHSLCCVSSSTTSSKFEFNAIGFDQRETNSTAGERFHVFNLVRWRSSGDRSGAIRLSVLVESLVEVFIRSVAFVFTVDISITFENGFVNTTNVPLAVAIVVAVAIAIRILVVLGRSCNDFSRDHPLSFNNNVSCVLFSFSQALKHRSSFVYTIETFFLLCSFYKDETKQKNNNNVDFRILVNRTVFFFFSRTDRRTANQRQKMLMDDYKYLFKVVLIGNASVGKTCLVRRFCQDVFPAGQAATIGVDFLIKTVDVNGERIKVRPSVRWKPRPSRIDSILFIVTNLGHCWSRTFSFDYSILLSLSQRSDHCVRHQQSRHIL